MLISMIDAEQKNINETAPTDEEIDLKEFFGILWASRALIFFLTSIFTLTAVLYSLSLTNIYISKAVLTSSDSKDSSVLSQYSGLASLAGIGLPGSQGDEVVETMEIIKSREFVKHLITFDNVLPSIMAAKSYDPSSRKLFFDEEVYDRKTNSWIRKPLNNKLSTPSYLEVHKHYLANVLHITRSDVTGFVSLGVEHISPIFAKEFLELIIKEANSLKREKDIVNSSKALDFLKNELSTTSLVEIKESINQLIKAQLETRMMAKINDEYALSLIEPPYVPEEKSKPNRTLIVILTTLLGVMLSLIFVLVRHYFFEKSYKTD